MAGRSDGSFFGLLVLLVVLLPLMMMLSRKPEPKTNPPSPEPILRWTSGPATFIEIDNSENPNGTKCSAYKGENLVMTYDWFPPATLAEWLVPIDQPLRATCESPLTKVRIIATP